MEYYLEDEPMVKEYREQRKQLEETIDLFNSYIRKATYELALNDGSKELIKVLQAELKITLEDEMQIDLGAVGKGFTGDLLAEKIKENSVKSALINLGGNVQTIGTKPDGSDWKVGITSPYGEGNFAVLEISDKAIVTSGGYERYFIGEDGRQYHHILNPETGKPAESGLISVSVIASEGRLCDALSTSLFVMGLEKAENLWKSKNDFDMILVTENGEIYITEGIEDNFSLNTMYSNLEVSVIHR